MLIILFIALQHGVALRYQHAPQQCTVQGSALPRGLRLHCQVARRKYRWNVIILLLFPRLCGFYFERNHSRRLRSHKVDWKQLSPSYSSTVFHSTLRILRDKLNWDQARGSGYDQHSDLCSCLHVFTEGPKLHSNRYKRELAYKDRKTMENLTSLIQFVFLLQRLCQRKCRCCSVCPSNDGRSDPVCRQQSWCRGEGDPQADHGFGRAFWTGSFNQF